ncbi:MAG: hypothetical protein SGBAC_004602 [Bacillariaceae sp.]
MKFHLAILLVASEILILIPHGHGLLLQPLKNPVSTTMAGGLSSLMHRSAASSTSRIKESPWSPISVNSCPRFTCSSSALHATNNNDDRITKAGGGVAQIPTGELKLFNPGEQGMKGSTLELEERLKSGASYHQAAEGGNGNASEASSSDAKLELSLFDPGQEGMNGGTSDFAERLKGGANFQQEKIKDQPTAKESPINGAASIAPELGAAAPPQASSTASPANVGSRAGWPYQPLMSSSFYSPAYPNVGVGRGRAAAIQKSYRDSISVKAQTHTVAFVPAAFVPTVPAAAAAEKTTPAGGGGGGTTTTYPNGTATAARTTTEKKATANNHFWGKQSNWWDKPSGMFQPN